MGVALALALRAGTAGAEPFTAEFPSPLYGAPPCLVPVDGTVPIRLLVHGGAGVARIDMVASTGGSTTWRVAPSGAPDGAVLGGPGPDSSIIFDPPWRGGIIDAELATGPGPPSADARSYRFDATDGQGRRLESPNVVISPEGCG